MGIHTEALESGHTLSVRARFSGVVMTDNLLAGVTVIPHDLKPETFNVEWSGTDVVLTDDNIKNFVIAEKLQEDHREKFNEGLGVVVSQYEPEWFRHFMVLEGAEPSAPGQGKKVSIYDRKAMAHHFNRALKLSCPTQLDKELEMGCLVTDLAPQIPLVNLSCALMRFANHMDDKMSAATEIRKISISTAPVFAN